VVNPRIVGRLWNGAEWMKKTMNKPPIGCFPAGTPVLMADGSQKPIEKVKVGEQVASAGEWSGDSGYSKVVRTYKRPHDTLLVIRTDDGKQIEATPEHPFWVEGKGFIAARRLARSDLLRAEDGRTAAITSPAGRPRSSAGPPPPLARRSRESPCSRGTSFSRVVLPQASGIETWSQSGTASSIFLPL
jgi:hypothetical protein